MTIEMRYDSFDYERICVIEAMSAVFYSAIYQKKFDIFDFTHKILSTDLFDRFPYDLSLFSQSPLYVIECLETDEFPATMTPIKKYNYKSDDEKRYISNVSEWVGYMLASWIMIDKISGKDILEKYDIDSVINSYERLHCMSISAAIFEIKSDFLKTKETDSLSKNDISKEME